LRAKRDWCGGSGVLRKSLVLWHPIKATDYLTAIAAFGAVFYGRTP